MIKSGTKSSNCLVEDRMTAIGAFPMDWKKLEVTMSNYKDRGILKWAPFDALEGHGTMLEEMIYNLAKKEKQELSDDSYKEMNEEINKALKNNKSLVVTYYNNGYTLTTFGKIKKIDEINKKLLLDTEENIDFDSILSLETK